jgi:hypothetical protein
VAEEKFHGIDMALEVGVKLGYHKTDEFSQVTLQICTRSKIVDTKRAMELEVRLACLCDTEEM